MNRAFLGFIAFVILLVTVVIIITSGGGHKKSPSSSVTQLKALPDYANTYADVSMTIDGQVNGEDAHRAIRVTVDQFQRKLDVLSGYNGNVIVSQSYENNQTAYDVFLRAINGAGFLAKRKNPKIIDDRGQCPLGQRFIFELDDGSDQLSRLWTTSCGTNIGTLGVPSSLLQSLFKNQITDYNKLTGNVRL